MADLNPLNIKKYLLHLFDQFELGLNITALEDSFEQKIPLIYCFAVYIDVPSTVAPITNCYKRFVIINFHAYYFN